MNSHVLLTGATGFVGQWLMKSHASMPWRCAVRALPESSSPEFFSVGNIDSHTDWTSVLNDIRVVVHMAARAHIMHDNCADPLAEYRQVNTEGTLNLARQAAAAGVKRFIFVSSIKVNGETTSGLQPFTESLTCEVQDPYGISKKEAEDGLRIIAAETGMEVVIIRPPLVYGAGVKANFLNLMKLADTSIPLPFGAINNKRSMVYVGNLVDFIIKCIDHPSAANQTFLVCDGEDLSLRSLVMMMRTSLGRPARLVPVPAVLFRIAGRIAGKPEVVDRLVGDLQTDSSKARKLLNWVPPFTVQQGINAAIASYLKCKE